jgi:ubiquitin-activating enzyme E1
MARALKKGFISVAVSGLFGHVFTDFGEHHVITDPNGEPKIMALVTEISQDGIVYTEDKQHHGFYENDFVNFKEVMGMEGLNGKSFQIKKIISPYSFQIEDLSRFGQYTRNGYVEEVKMPQKGKFQSLKSVLENPQAELIDSDMDFENMDKMHILKAILIQLWKFNSTNQSVNFFENDDPFARDLEN